jgi:hypothetical protein
MGERERERERERGAWLMHLSDAIFKALRDPFSVII